MMRIMRLKEKENDDLSRTSKSSGIGFFSIRPSNQMASASLFSRLFFLWPYKLLKLGLERPLEEIDLPEIVEAESSMFNRHKFDQLWAEEKRLNPKNPSFQRALLKDYVKSNWYIHPFMFIAFLLKMAQAIGLGLLIESFQTGNGDGYKWAAIIVVSGLINLFEHHHRNFVIWRQGSQYRIATVATVYAKSLRLSSIHQDVRANAGTIMNLASNDVERFFYTSVHLCNLIVSPFEVIAALVAGWWVIGPAFSAGMGLLVFGFFPIQFWLSKRFAFFRSRVASITDRRVSFVSQAVHGARVMKQSGYEWRFLDRIKTIRKEEVDEIAKANDLRAINEALFFASNVVICMTIFLVHVLTGGVLSAGVVFTCFTMVNVIQLEITRKCSLAVMSGSECYVTIERLRRFLEHPELPSRDDKTHRRAVRGTKNAEKDSLAISMLNCNCYWNDALCSETENNDEDSNAEKEAPSNLVEALSNISIDFHLGNLTCIIGTVGSGKSALLQSVIGELPIFSGNVERSYETLAYAAQDPWIMDGTVKENITMGLEFDREWYDQVIASCGLAIDFKQFANGDETIVGDRGVQCSGGQRARIGLARALYRDADVLVLDDPLSAVDAKVGRQLFKEAINGLAVSRGICVILATHQHQYVSDHRCVLMDGGRIKKIGSYDECIAVGGAKLIAQTADDSIDTLESINSVGTTPLENIGLSKAKTESNNDKDGPDDNTESSKDGQKETKSSGIVEFGTYVQYAKAMGGASVVCFLLVLYTVTQGSVLFGLAFIGRWSQRPAQEQNSSDILGLIVGLAFAVLCLGWLRAMLTFKFFVKASQKLHDKMTFAVLRSKIEFFDTNPLGRILNRFSADVGSNDDMLPLVLLDTLVVLFLVLGSVCTTFVVLPYALLIMPPLLWYFLSVRHVFVTSTRELKRLEGMARSPIFAMISESFSGIATIRAHESMDYFTRKFEDAHDAHSRSYFAFLSSSRWVGFRMDSLMFLLMAFTSFASVLFQQQGWFEIDPAILGLSISLLLQLSDSFQWMIRQSAEVVNLMIAVERVLGFAHLEPEASLEVEDNDAQLQKSNWPTDGAIDVRDLAARYRATLPLALNGISFSIPKRARVGIVGRTGSGKSTTVQTLFRLLEAEQGSISIDGVDISTIGLHTLRTKISVIPQLPTLFGGCTVRENLDLFGIHSIDAIQKALKDVHLGDVIAALPKGLDSIVSEGGSNFSVGQRQLLCLARAILSKNKILVLDEATASVDRRTDQLLQESIKASFNDATIMAVAHRLDTVIDYDLILVLGQGKVLEYGSPANLIRSNGMFARMVDDTGETMSRQLQEKAFAVDKAKKKAN